MSVRQYAELSKYSVPAITKALREGRPLPGVLKHRLFGRVHILTVDPEQVKINPRKG